MPDDTTTAPLPEDGQKVVQKRRQQRYLIYLGLLVGYMFGGCILYWLLEGWNPLQSLVFILSILTGVGYGHLAPSSQGSMLVTSFVVMSGLVMFATIAGQILDFIMQIEISAATDFISNASEEVGFDENRNQKHHQDYHEKQVQGRRQQFFVGCLNMSVIYLSSVVWFIFGYGYTFCEAMYMASLSVLKLDSLCTIDGVKCAAGSHTSRGGEAKDLALAIVWCVITYSTIGHFLVAACNYMGADPDPVMTKVRKITKGRLQRMDKDGDMRITRAEFLRDRLIQGGICDATQIDRILQNFDDMDKNHSGFVSQKDVK